MGDDIVKKKMIVLIAFIYIASMLFCGDGVGKKFVEEKFPHLTYSDKECDDSKKKELRIVEDEDTAGGILSYEELAAMENENASVRNNMLPDTDQLAFVDEAEKNGELAEIKEQQNVKMPQVDMSFDNLAFSFQLQLMANEYYPGLARRIYLKGYRYNMHLCPKSLLVEVGAQTNTKEEAYNAMEPLADILDKVLK